MKYVYACIIILPLIASGFICCRSRPSIHAKKSLFRHKKEVARYVQHKKGDPLRILFVVDSFPHFDQPFILDQIVGLIDRGHEIYIAAMTEVKNNFLPDVVYDALMERTLFFGQSNPLQLLQHHPTIPHITSFDVIYCQFGNVGADIVRFKKGVRDISAKLVTCWRGAFKEARMKKYVYSTLFAKGDLFLPVCEFLKNTIIQLGCDANKIAVIYSGINYDLYVCERAAQKHGNIINLMSVCRLVEKKRY